jgi:uncharacterized protein YfaT (DUF1175 family)
MALTGVLLVSSVSLAWRFYEWTTRVEAVEEAPPRHALRKEDEGRKACEGNFNLGEGHAEGASFSTISRADEDADGIPDAAELSSYSDRENFRRWLTAIAEMQFYSLSDEWNASQRDCAGLVRFAWREALRRHDRAWLKRMGSGYDLFTPDICAYTLETSPLGEKLFRRRSGLPAEGGPESQEFSEFADARSLKDFNSVFISRDRRLVQPGDLLFFFQPRASKFPYHVMIFIGAAREASAGARDWVVYHTGATVEDAGVVKKVRLSVLDRHPDVRWRPLESNPNFLGFYRLKILD